MTGNLLPLLVRRVAHALCDMPSPMTCLATAALLAITAGCCLPLGLKSGFFAPSRASLPMNRVKAIVLGSLLFPALSEEIAFRVVPLPRADEGTSFQVFLISAALSLIAFVLYRPIKARLSPSAKGTVFTDLRFLSLATMVGAACTVSYRLS